EHDEIIERVAIFWLQLLMRHSHYRAIRNQTFAVEHLDLDRTIRVVAGKLDIKGIGLPAAAMPSVARILEAGLHDGPKPFADFGRLVRPLAVVSRGSMKCAAQLNNRDASEGGEGILHVAGFLKRHAHDAVADHSRR